jgi:hypothetical protein
LWRKFLKNESVDFENIIEFDFGDVFYKSRIAQKRGLHSFAIDKTTQALSDISSHPLFKELPNEYIYRFVFLRAESKRRLDGSGNDDYLKRYNSGFKRNFVQGLFEVKG